MAEWMRPRLVLIIVFAVVLRLPNIQSQEDIAPAPSVQVVLLAPAPSPKQVEVNASAPAPGPPDGPIETSPTPGLPEATLCLLNGPCNLVVLTCPGDCPQRGAVNHRACYLDCVNCQASCRNRKLNCFGYGSVCYDPRFIGGDGVMFYFHGRKDEDFCLFTDRRLHINAHFIGKRPEGRPRDFTWVQSLGIMLDSHTFTIGSKKVSKWNDDVDQFFFSYDGEDFALAAEEGAVWTSSGFQEITVKRTSATNTVHLVIDQFLDAMLSIVPITVKESRVHNYGIGPDDCYAHLNMEFSFYQLSSSVEGILGQTYQPGFKTPVNVRVPMPILGGTKKYKTSSLLSSDCEVSKFAPAKSPEDLDRGSSASESFDGLIELPRKLQLDRDRIRPALRCDTSGLGGVRCRR